MKRRNRVSSWGSSAWLFEYGPIEAIAGPGSCRGFETRWFRGFTSPRESPFSPAR